MSDAPPANSVAARHARAAPRRRARRRRAAHRDGARHPAGPAAPRRAGEDAQPPRLCRVRLRPAVPRGDRQAGRRDHPAAARAAPAGEADRGAVHRTEARRRRRSAQRAMITDRNGQILAISLPTVAVFADPRQIIDPAEAAHRLKQVLPRLDEDGSADAAVRYQPAVRLSRTPDHAARAARHQFARHSRDRFPPDRAAALSDGPHRRAGAGRHRRRRARRRRRREVLRPAPVQRQLAAAAVDRRARAGGGARRTVARRSTSSRRSAAAAS